MADCPDTKPPRVIRRAQKDPDRAGSIATGRRPWEKAVTVVWVVLTLAAFAWSMFGEGKLSEMSLEIGILLLSLKFAWSLMQEAKVNHYMFWILQTLEHKVIDLSADVRRQRRSLRALEREIAALREETDNGAGAVGEDELEVGESATVRRD
jgi:hypothetical protein